MIESSLEGDSSYEIVLIFTDVRDDRPKKSGDKMCSANDIAEEYGIVYECVDIRDFYKARGVDCMDHAARTRPEVLIDPLNIGGLHFIYSFKQCLAGRKSGTSSDLQHLNSIP
ncbi:unnamed protein product [marine sediment metagenome]|uniref:Uncharacterized protein n=1 Tax=marine sediment metagenome TaxID=412755 RepID=X1U7Y9_9ZZZZ